MPATQTVYPTINPDCMPESSQYELAKATFKSMLRFFERPGELERCEAWKRERDQRQSMAQKGEE